MNTISLHDLPENCKNADKLSQEYLWFWLFGNRKLNNLFSITSFPLWLPAYLRPPSEENDNHLVRVDDVAMLVVVSGPYIVTLYPSYISCIDYQVHLISLPFHINLFFSRYVLNPVITFKYKALGYYFCNCQSPKTPRIGKKPYQQTGVHPGGYAPGGPMSHSFWRPRSKLKNVPPPP